MRRPRKVLAVLALVIAVVSLADPVHGFPYIPVGIALLATGELINGGY